MLQLIMEVILKLQDNKIWHKKKEINDKWLLSYHLLLPLYEINKLSNYEINFMVKEIKKQIKK